MPPNCRTRKISKSIARPGANEHNPDKSTAKRKIADFRYKNRIRQHAPQLQQTGKRETDIDNPRALPAEELAERLIGTAPCIEVINSPQKAYDKALTYGGDIFICGSLYLASELRPYIINNKAAPQTKAAE